MSDIIKLLPESVANQIAAGEVIQRPASVVKELMENAVDAGSTSITVIVKEGGKNLVQVIDNGKGMSETDARMAFERHATSKITTAHDLFAIRTMGFRGEALASIASVAEVTLKTRRLGDELGTELNIAGSQVISQEPLQCPEGSNFSIRNLFYNIPARRKFLKATSTELRNIINEFLRVALAFPGIELALMHNQTEIYNLPAGNQRQRLLNVFGKNLNAQLVDIRSDTSIVKISGFIGKPESARKSISEQYFFANNRYIRHPYFHRAVIQAYEKLIPPDTSPAYFIFFESDPANIDINIHPTKTEVKFEDEQAIWKILNAGVRESLGRFSLMPSLDFDTIGVVEIPVLTKNTEIRMPEIQVNKEYNPFEEEDRQKSFPKYETSLHRSKGFDWEKLYAGFETETRQQEPSQPEETQGEDLPGNHLFFQYKDRYIVTPVKSGLMFIDQRRAHERILFEQYLSSLQQLRVSSQQNLFPQTIHLSATEYVVLKELNDDLQFLGFDIADLGNSTIAINGYPPDMQGVDPEQAIRQMIREFVARPVDMKEEARERMASSLALAMAIPYGKKLNDGEMRILIDKLFACDNPGIAPDGRVILYIYSLSELENKFE